MHYIFITKSTLHNIYAYQNEFGSLEYNITIIIVTIICIIITRILKEISFTENIFLNLKYDSKKKRHNYTDIYIDITFKNTLFYIIGLLVLCIFWFYIASYFAIYPKAQIYILIKSSISFGVSFIIPFIYNIFVVIVRFSALKCGKKQYLYTISILLQLMI